MFNPVLAEKELLEKMKVVDTSSRVIKSHDSVEFKCYQCSSIGTKEWCEAKKSFRLKGFAYQCPSCLKAKYKDRGPEWLANIRTAAQTPEHKARAVQNGKKRLALKDLKNVQDFWDFGNVDIQKVPGVEVVRAICKRCGSQEEKPLKKIIEACDHQSHGCMNCWSKNTKSPDYAKIMSNRSSPAGSEPRIRQSNSLDNFYKNAPDSYFFEMSIKSKERWKSLPVEIRTSIGLERARKLRAWWDALPPDEAKRIRTEIADKNIKSFSSKAELEILEWVRSLGPRGQ